MHTLLTDMVETQDEMLKEPLIFIAIKSFANEKSPGCDDLTAEFCQTFFSVIANDLVEVY